MCRRRLYFASRSERTDGPYFDLAGSGRDRQVGEKIVFGFTGTRGNTALIPGLAGAIDHRECLGEGSGLIHLDQHGVGGSRFDTAIQTGEIGRKQIVANQLDASTKILVR